MGMLNFLRSLPEWAKELLPHLDLSADQIRRLEAIRVEFGIEETPFVLHLTGHTETTKRLQRRFYLQIQQQMPGASERDVLKHLLLTRLYTAIEHGMDLFELSELEALDDEAMLLGRIEVLVSQYPNLEALIDAMVQEDERRGPVIPTASGFEDAARRVAAILAER